jgi:catechol 2,3-dioxygenase-like lactoylglutathione lyase family enzyme
MPAADDERLIAFYRRLGFEIRGEEDWRSGRARVFSLGIGSNKINVHPTALVAKGNFLRGDTATPGCADVCFVWEGGVEQLLALLVEADVPVLDGPVQRVGGQGMGTSVYVRDPDGNLVEFISY